MGEVPLASGGGDKKVQNRTYSRKLQRSCKEAEGNPFAHQNTFPDIADADHVADYEEEDYVTADSVSTVAQSESYCASLQNKVSLCAVAHIHAQFQQHT